MLYWCGQWFICLWSSSRNPLCVTNLGRAMKPICARFRDGSLVIERFGMFGPRNMPGSSQPCYNAAKLTISTFFSKGENSELGETRFSLPQLFAGKVALVCLSCVSNWKISKATVKLPSIFDGAPLLSVDLTEQAKPLL